MDSPALTLLAPSRAVGAGLVVPRLDAMPRPRGRAHERRRIARLALAMLELGIAHPWQWAGDAGKFVELAFARWVADHGGATIRRRFDLLLQLTTSQSYTPYGSEAWPDVLLFAVYPDLAARYELGATFEALEAMQPGLSATVWHGLTQLWHVAPTYAWDEAIECAEWHAEGFDSDDDENIFRPVLPAALKHKRLTRSQLQRASRRDPHVAMIARHLAAVRRAATRCRRIRQRLWWQPLGMNDDLGEPLPIAVFQTSEHDEVSAAFDWQYQHIELEPAPVTAIAVASMDRAAVARAFADLEAVLVLLASVAELLDVLPALSGYRDETAGATLAEVFERTGVLQYEQNAPSARELVRVVA